MFRKLRRRLREKSNPQLKVQRLEYRRWRTENGEARRTRFPGLTPDSVVFDIGGFRGTWADAIHAHYGCEIQVFEPHPGFAAELEAKYSDVPEIRVHAFALGAKDGVISISDQGDASSALTGDGESLRGRVVSVENFMTGFPTPTVDLAKINIEGGEYELLPALFAASQLGRFARFQIQFHLFEPGHVAAREEIRGQLSLTHVCDWSYDFIWEQWSRKPAAG